MSAVVPDGVEIYGAAAFPMAEGTALGARLLAGTTNGCRLLVTADNIHNSIDALFARQ